MIYSKLRVLLNKTSQIVNKKAIIIKFSVDSRSLLIIFCMVFFVSCNQFPVNKEEVIARVGTVYLYRTDLEKSRLSFKNKADSILKTRSFIDKWARSQVLIQQARINLDSESINNLNQLINQYEIDLYSKTYKQSIIDQSIDADVSIKELDSFLLLNQSVFKLNAPLFQVRYIELPADNVDINEIKRSFQRFNEEDRHYLDSLSFQFTNHILADSIWINKSNLLSEVTFLNQENLNRYIKKTQFFEIEDSLGVYLFFVKKYLNKGDISPKEVLYPTIKNIILNQRKLQFNNQFEKEIIQDAIKSKTYEIY